MSEEDLVRASSKTVEEGDTGASGGLVTDASCLALMEGDEIELTKADKFMKDHLYYKRSDKEILTEITTDCDNFRRKLESKGSVLEEKNFPLAFTILFHSEGEQVVRLLRQIYQPHNFYCLHVDAKSPPVLIETARGLAACLPNVCVPDQLVTVVYGHFSRLEAELNCMKLLLAKSSRWRYLINLTGQMFPLKTNLEIVKILSTYKDSNDIEGLSRWHMEGVKNRVNTKWIVEKGKMKKTTLAYEDPPHGISLVKGSAYGAYTRKFLQFVFSDPKVTDFIAWCRHVFSPDEVFWATLNSRWVNPMFLSPGGHDAAPERKPWLAAYAAWNRQDKCGGKFVRNACVFGVADLPRLVGRRELFANKFHTGYQYLTVDCLEEWLRNKTLHRLPIDLEFYRNIKEMLEYTNR